MNKQKALNPPDLPPLMFCALGTLIGAASAHTLFEHVAETMCLYSLVYSVLALGICAYTIFCKGVHPFLIVVLGLLLGVASAASHAVKLHGMQDFARDSPSQSYLVQIVEDVQDSDFGQYAIGIARSKSGVNLRVRINVPKDSSIQCWDVFEAKVRIRSPAQTARSYYWRKACVGSISPSKVDYHGPSGLLGAVSSLRRLGINLFSSIPGEGALFLRSVVFGDRRALFSSDLYGDIKRVGLAHVVAVSGAHLSITIAALALFLRILHVPKIVSVLVQMLMCVLYVLFTGAPHSAMRACIMVLCMLASFFGKRRSFALNALSVCLVAFLLIQPPLALSVSLLLSSASTFGIVLFAHYFGEWFFSLFGQGRSICDLLGMTTAALACTLPITIPLFGQVSLIAPLSNVMVAPLFALLCVGGMLTTLVMIVFPAGILLGFACELADYFCSGIHLLASIPYAATNAYIPAWLTVPLAGIWVFVLIRTWPPPSRRVALGICVALSFVPLGIFYILPQTHGTEIIMLDVGQGDAFVLRSGRQALLIDTGNQDTRVLQALARHDIRHLDAVLITHPDNDHCGSLSSIQSFVEVDRVLVAHDLLTCTCANCTALKRSASQIEMTGLYVGDTFSLGNISAEILAPNRFIEEGGNNDSIVLLARLTDEINPHNSMLGFFCGDAESEVLSQLDRNIGLPEVDILKIGHHGSAGACTSEQLASLSPKLALVSVGANNRYGHPAQETLELLNHAGIPCYRSDEQGDVVCKLLTNRVLVETQR